MYKHCTVATSTNVAVDQCRLVKKTYLNCLKKHVFQGECSLFGNTVGMYQGREVKFNVRGH